MKFPIALLALLTNSGAYANQGIRGSTTEYLQLPECPARYPGYGPYMVEDVDEGKTMVVNCEDEKGNTVGYCKTFPGPKWDKCKLSDACVDYNDPVALQGETTMTATGGTVMAFGECALRCYGLGCKLEEVRSEAYALDSFDMITKE
jgi:hypothetical protein